MTVLLVAAGGAVGAVLRLLVQQRLGTTRGTLAVNVLGSLALGLVTGLGPGPYALLGMGVCGAFTTFSTFAAQALDVGWRYVALTVGLCLPAAALGLAVVRSAG